MATGSTVTPIGTSSSVAQKIWRPVLNHQAERSWISHLLIGTDEDSCIQLQDEPSKLHGDTVQVRFSPTIEQPGFGEDDDIEGNEADLRFDFDEFKIGFHAMAHKQRNQMSQQRININIKKAITVKHPVLWKRFRERTFFAQLGGATYLNSAAGIANAAVLDPDYTYVNNWSDNRLTGMNAAVAFDSAHIVYAGAANTTAALVGADTTATMSLSLIDSLVEKAETRAALDYPIAPCSLGYWILVISPEQKKQLRRATSSGDWADLERAKLEGGLPWDDSEFRKGCVGIYNNTLIVVSDFLPRGRDSADTPEANTRVALFLGAKAGVIAYGQGYTDGQHLDWTEQVRNYKVWGVSTDSVYGFKRLTFPNISGTTQTYGCLALVTYVAQ